MRSGTSFFNAALWRKTMGRFWPLWALYAAAWTFALPLYLLNQFVGGRSRGYGAVDVQDWMLSAAQDMLHEGCYTIPMVNTNAIYGLKEGVQGLEAHPGYVPDLTGVYFE